MSKNYLGLEIKSNKIFNNEEKRMKMSLQKLHVQKIKWRLQGTNALCWTLFMH